MRCKNCNKPYEKILGIIIGRGHITEGYLPLCDKCHPNTDIGWEMRKREWVYLKVKE